MSTDTLYAAVTTIIRKLKTLSTAKHDPLLTQIGTLWRIGAILNTFQLQWSISSIDSGATGKQGCETPFIKSSSTANVTKISAANTEN